MAESHNAVKLIEKLNTLTNKLLEKIDVEKSEQLDLEEIKKMYLERGKIIDSLEEFAHSGGQDPSDLWAGLDQESQDRAKRLYYETLELAEYVEMIMDGHLTVLENKKYGQYNLN